VLGRVDELGTRDRSEAGLEFANIAEANLVNVPGTIRHADMLGILGKSDAKAVKVAWVSTLPNSRPHVLPCARRSCG